jgi:chaperonin GroES
MELDEILYETNIAESLSEEQLVKIGAEAYQGYMADKGSRRNLEDMWEHWTKIALQVAEAKTYPWPKASNVKYPLLSTAAMQFAARAYPTLIPSDGQVVKCKVLGSDPTGEKTERADRVGRYMSYQVMEEMEEWEGDMDRLLITLPITGVVFKKTYYDRSKGRNKSCLVMPQNLVVNYWAKSLEDAERVTEIIPMTQRVITERVKAGLFLDVDLGDPKVLADNQSESKTYGLQPPQLDKTTPFNILEQHAYLDLDEDGYDEPYVITFEEQSTKVLRIAPRFEEDGIKLNDKGELEKITPLQFYTKYGFIPNPDGGFYDIGFGRLLGPINDSVDTITNLLIDSGSLSNLQAGFIGKGLRLKMGDNKFTPGEWKAVNATGDDIKKQIFPLPVREPSDVLFKLLQFLIESGNKLASVAEIMVGKMPGQNTPATTTMATIEQGMKVFTAVYKRIYRSLTDEFRKLYKLNGLYLDDYLEVDALGENISQADFTFPIVGIIPAADPNAVSSQEKQAKVQAIMPLLQLGTINPMAVTKLALDAFEIPNAESYMMEPQPQPDPEAQKAEAELALKQEEHGMKMQTEQMKLRIKEAEGKQKLQLERELAQQRIQSEAVKGTLDREAAQINHQQTMMQSSEKHAASMQQQREAAQNKPTPKKEPKKK